MPLHSSALPATVCGYRVHRLLASGSSAQARAYVVSRPGHRRPSIVLKELSGIHGERLDRLRSDFAALCSLQHTALLLPTGCCREPSTGRWYLTRPFVEATDFLAAAGSRPAQLLSWLIAAAQSLELLHRFGYVHGNVKSENLLVPKAQRSAGGSGARRVLITDPAWWPLDGRRPSRRRASNPPAEHANDFAADLHALGSVFYHLLRGESPTGEASHFSDVAENSDALSRDLARVIRKLLQPHPQQRYRSCATLLDDLYRLRPSGSDRKLEVPECFVGREEELERADGQLRARGGDGIVVIGGAAGMGKTSFVRHLCVAREIEGYRCAVLALRMQADSSPTVFRALAASLIPIGAEGRKLRSRFRFLMEQLLTESPDHWTEPAHRFVVQQLVDLFRDALARSRTCLVFEDLQLADRLAIEFVVALIKRLSSGCFWDVEESSPVESRLQVIVTHRSERPFQASLASLLQALRRAEAVALRLELLPLHRKCVDEWIDTATEGSGHTPRDRVPEHVRASGIPLAVHEALRLGGGLADEGPRMEGLSDVHRRYLESLPPDDQAILTALALLNRPASEHVLAAVTGRPKSAVRSCLQALVSDSTLVEDADLYVFRHNSFSAWLREGLERDEKAKLHSRIASWLETDPAASIEENAHHWLRSHDPRRGLESAVEAARNLARNYEYQRAIDYYEAVVKLLSEESPDRRSLVEEMAEAYSRAGQHRRAFEIASSLIGTQGSPEAEGRLQGRIGSFAHRAGEIDDAVEHLEQGRRLLASSTQADLVRERGWIESELAEIASNRGDYASAEALCSEGLRAVDQCTEDSRSRRLMMILVETLAHVHLRRFEYDEARRLFERSLRISEELGTAPETSLILNNLGILHNQQNRFEQAIECYSQASALSQQLGDEVALVNVESNLALLYAKTGDLRHADAALRRAVRYESQCDSSRSRFMRLHSAGVVDLLFGRYAAASDSLRRAIQLGQELKDWFLVAFDFVYLAESHLFRGEAGAALTPLDRALSLPSTPPVLASMVAARRALAYALREQEKDALRELGAVEDPFPGADYLRAWNLYFVGWSRRLLGHHGAAVTAFEEARSLFKRAAAWAGFLHVELELVACELEQQPSRAKTRLRGLAREYVCGVPPLTNAMLCARFLGFQSKLLFEREPPDIDAAASTLLEAEAYLIGRRLGEVEMFLKAQRRELQRATLTSLPASDRAVASRKHTQDESDLFAQTVHDLAEEFIGSWETELGAERMAPLRRSLHEFHRQLEQTQRARESEQATPWTCDCSSIIGRSAAIDALTSAIRQLAASDLPVLIRGETGAGKELVARAIHGESPRRAGPFVSINCAALPEELLAAELFGHRKGAYSGAEEDRIGLIVSAQGGTLLFDEVGEMTLSLQGKLLRVLDRKRVRPLGGSEEIEVDARCLFTTHRDLPALVEEGEFRADLYYRLRGFEVEVPPLRQRLEDLPLLIEETRMNCGLDRPPTVDSEALRVLASYSWPGNVRELQNVMTRLVFSVQEIVRASDVEQLLEDVSGGGVYSAAFLRSRPLSELVRELEKEYFEQLSRDKNGRVQDMARELGVSVQALYKRFKSLGISKTRRSDRR